MTQANRDLRNIFYPKCPYNDSVLVLVLRMAVIVLGTIGIGFLNVWLAGLYLIYSIVYNLIIWPVIHCQYCFYKIKQTSPNDTEGKDTRNLLPLDEWKETYLDKHVACGKKWGSPNLMILWLGPIALIIISFFVSFDPLALVTLIGFLSSLAITGIYVPKIVCRTCAFKEECHAAF